MEISSCTAHEIRRWWKVKESFVNYQIFPIFSCRAVILADRYTREITLLLRDELHNLYGEYPHVIINELHRSKLDANRRIDQAAWGIPSMEEAWRQVKLKHEARILALWLKYLKTTWSLWLDKFRVTDEK